MLIGGRVFGGGFVCGVLVVTGILCFVCCNFVVSVLMLLVLAWWVFGSAPICLSWVGLCFDVWWFVV